CYGGVFCVLASEDLVFKPPRLPRHLSHHRKEGTMNRTGIMGMLITLLLTAFVSSPADAYHSRLCHHLSYRGADVCTFTNDGRSVCGTGASYRTSATPAVDAVGNRTYAMAETGTIIGSRPAGCPNRYCGCGLRMYLGLSDVRLN